MPRGSKIPSMVRDAPDVVVEGMEDILERDLFKHRGLRNQAEAELLEYRNGRAYEARKKKHYQGLMSFGKYNAESMELAIGGIDINIRHMEDKAKLAKEKIEHHQEIIAALEKDLASQYRGLKCLKEQRENGLAN